MKLLNKFQKIKKTHLQVAGILLLLFIAAFLLWFGNATSMQAGPTLRIELYFKGEYSIDNGPWQTYVEGEHIPATKGDVTLKGNLYKRYEGEELGIYNSDDLPVAFYTDHINLTFCEVDEKGEKNHFVIDNENPIYGNSACGESWTAHSFAGGNGETIKIFVHNPHSFGNETAIDEMLSSMAFWAGIDFEQSVLNDGEPQRNTGMLLILVSIVFLGIALFSSLIHIKNSKIIWLLGLVVLFAGMYFAYSADGVSFWSESIVSNTAVLGFSMMFYMLFLLMSISYFLKSTGKIGEISVIVLSVANAVFLILPIFSDVFFYDTWIWWVVVQLVANTIFLLCIIKEFVSNKTKERWLYISLSLPLLAFDVDVIGTWLGTWHGGLVSKYVFVVLFAVAMIMVLKLIPRSINAATKAKELEMEKIVLNAQLADSRIATMMSQIRPHFIYNTLGSIEQLCKLDPPKAGELVHNFAKYLRGNFGELDNPKPILMSQEMDHVHHYVSIENVRFPDMTFTFEMHSEDFHIPALTVQPIVENAIKHGLMRLETGGLVVIHSYETPTHFCVEVKDNGVGFDTTLPIDEKKHIGLRNIQGRLKAMVNGELLVESELNVGTKAIIMIPKEVAV